MCVSGCAAENMNELEIHIMEVAVVRATKAMLREDGCAEQSWSLNEAVSTSLEILIE